MGRSEVSSLGFLSFLVRIGFVSDPSLGGHLPPSRRVLKCTSSFCPPRFLGSPLSSPQLIFPLSPCASPPPWQAGVLIAAPTCLPAVLMSVFWARAGLTPVTPMRVPYTVPPPVELFLFLFNVACFLLVSFFRITSMTLSTFCARQLYGRPFPPVHWVPFFFALFFFFSFSLGGISFTRA